MNGMPKCGITGTREGATEAQLAALIRILLATDATSMHHGDCIGADRQAHVIGKARGMYICIYPPIDPKSRAFCTDWDECETPLPYLERNKLIVNHSSFLVAMPRAHYEEDRSGTWAAVRYARKQNMRSIFILAPDGSTL